MVGATSSEEFSNKEPAWKNSSRKATKAVLESSGHYGHVVWIIFTLRQVPQRLWDFVTNFFYKPLVLAVPLPKAKPLAHWKLKQFVHSSDEKRASFMQL